MIAGGRRKAPVIEDKVTTFEEFPGDLVGLDVAAKGGKADSLSDGELDEGNPILAFQVTCHSIILFP
jgi:hypothetical protein